MTVYPTETQRTTGGASYTPRKAIVAIKQAVPVETYAATLTELRPSGTSYEAKAYHFKAEQRKQCTAQQT